MSTRPVVGSVAEELYAALGPWAEESTRIENWDLLNFCEAIVGGAKLQDLEDIIRDGEDGSPGWSAIMDVDRAPAVWLPWLAQFVGVRLPGDISEEDMRDKIRLAEGFTRGSITSFRAAPLPYLTGDRTVIVNERYQGSAWRVAVATITAETPDPERVLRALTDQKPAGILLTYLTMDEWTYQGLSIEYDLYSDAKAHFYTYADLKLNDSH